MRTAPIAAGPPRGEWPEAGRFWAHPSCEATMTNAPPPPLATSLTRVTDRQPRRRASAWRIGLRRCPMPPASATAAAALRGDQPDGDGPVLRRLAQGLGRYDPGRRQHPPGRADRCGVRHGLVRCGGKVLVTSIEINQISNPQLAGSSRVQKYLESINRDAQSRAISASALKMTVLSRIASIRHIGNSLVFLGLLAR